MLFDWFNAKEATEMALKLADELSEALAKVNNSDEKKHIISRDKVVQKIFSQLDQFKQNQQLNFYKKSKLVNEFRWRLLELGHDKEYVEAMTKELVIRIY